MLANAVKMYFLFISEATSVFFQQKAKKKNLKKQLRLFVPCQSIRYMKECLVLIMFLFFSWIRLTTHLATKIYERIIFGSCRFQDNEKITNMVRLSARLSKSVLWPKINQVDVLKLWVKDTTLKTGFDL